MSRDSRYSSNAANCVPPPKKRPAFARNVESSARNARAIARWYDRRNSGVDLIATELALQTRDQLKLALVKMLLLTNRRSL
jgi:hypothetical protein